MNKHEAATTDIRRALASILDKYGRQVLDEPWRVQGLLNDYCPTQKREITALVAAQKERAVADLATLTEHDSVSLVIGRWARQLYDRVGLAESLAYWAVESWALVLGVLSEPAGPRTVTLDGSLVETVVSTTSTTTDTAAALDAAFKSAKDAMKEGQLGAGADCLRSILQADPGNTQAQSQLDRILAKRKEYLRQAENHWIANHWTKAVAVLEKAKSRFPDDKEIAERLANWHQAAARVLGALNHEIPKLKTQKRFHTLVKLLEELEELKVPLQGLKQNLSTLKIRIAAIEPVLREAHAEFDRQQYQPALLHCERVLAAVADHPEAQQLRQQILAKLGTIGEQAQAIHRAIESGLWAEAQQLLTCLPTSVLQRAPFDAYQRQVEQLTGQMLGYWRLLAAAPIGALLWILSGWLGHLVDDGLQNAFPHFAAGPILRASVFSTQMLFASILLGIGSTLLSGRKGLESIYRTCIVSAAATLLYLTAATVLNQDEHPALTRWTLLSITAAAGGLLIGSWLRTLLTPRRLTLVLITLTAAVMSVGISLLWETIEARCSSPMAADYMVTLAISAVNLTAALAVFGLVNRWWKFGLMPIGVLLACSLSSYLATTDLSALTVIALGGAILAGAAVPSLESSLPWPAMIGVLALGLAASLATHWALTINTIPHVAILMTTWSSAIFVQALRSAGQPNARYFTAGMQFLTRPRSTELNDTNHSTTLS